jgi:hypothetical protein
MSLSLVFSVKTVCKLLIFVAWGARGPGFKSRRPDQTVLPLTSLLIGGRQFWSPLGVHFRSNPLGRRWRRCLLNAAHLSLCRRTQRMATRGSISRVLPSQEDSSQYISTIPIRPLEGLGLIRPTSTACLRRSSFSKESGPDPRAGFRSASVTRPDRVGVASTDIEHGRLQLPNKQPNFI